MIRFIYWVLVFVEVFLVLSVLVLFIVTDSRSIKYIAKSSLNSSKLSYESIEGNLFNGLEVQNLKYKNKQLFNSALIHWNPLTLFYNKITLTQVDAKGIEIDNILFMLDDLGTNKEEDDISLGFSLAVNSSHFDINPYVYEGIKFSSFILETGKIEVDKQLILNTENLYLKFDSDIVNVVLNGKIDESRLLIEDLALKNISSKEITHLVRRLRKEKKSSSSKNIMPIKEIKIKHILGTLRAVQYGDLKIKKASLHLYNGMIDPSNGFEYQIEKLNFKGETNFGLVNYKGYIKDSNIYAEGKILLNKILFSKYSLPLNFKNLKKIPSKLKLNHYGVWVDVNHNSKKLLNIKSDFNINILQGEHHLSYLYKEHKLSIQSEIKAESTYMKNMEIKGKSILDFGKEGLHYTGTIKALEVNDVLPKFSSYLLKNFLGEYKGTVKGLEFNFESDLIKGTFISNGFKNGNLHLKSKKENIALNKIVENIDKKFKNEYFAFKSDSYFDFNHNEKSYSTFDITSNLIELKSKGIFSKPFELSGKVKVPSKSLLRTISEKIRFEALEDFQFDLKIKDTSYALWLNDFMRKTNITLEYDRLKEKFKKVNIVLGKDKVDIKSNVMGRYTLATNTKNIQNFLNSLSKYVKIEIPSIQGAAKFSIMQKNNSISVDISSPNIKYLSDTGVNLSIINIYDMQSSFEIDDKNNIILKHYKFKIDDNPYISRFYATKPSYLSFNDNKIFIKKLRINDDILLDGDYDMTKSKGNFKINTHAYVFKNQNLNLLFDANLVLKVKKELFDIEGEIVFLGKSINYEIENSGIVEDSDIIVIEDMIKNKDEALQNLKLYLKINNKKPLNYYGKDSNIDFYNELSIVKNYQQKMLVTGTTTITKGYYLFEDKKFVLDESHLYFTGDIKKPLLDIKASYEKEEYNIHIFISGTTDEPIVNFNSEPYLTQQEILSLILFDGTGSSSGKGAEAYTLLGGTFAKGLIKSLGIDVDHLLLGRDAEEQLSLEIGKKISKDISVLYLHKDGLDGVKVRIEHSKSFETDIIIQPPNTSSIEFLYKQDR